MDKKCPFTSDVSIRGRIMVRPQPSAGSSPRLCTRSLTARSGSGSGDGRTCVAFLSTRLTSCLSLLAQTGIVKSTKMNRTVTVRRDCEFHS